MRLLAMTEKNHSVIPAKAGIHSTSANRQAKWIPAFAGMTVGRSTDNLLDSFCCVHIPL